MSFANLKRNSSDLSKLTKAMEKITTKDSSGNKDNFWKPEVDKLGNGMATFRFLPEPGIDGVDALPLVEIYSHGFQGPGGWLIDNCLTTKKGQCPVCEHNSALWTSGIEANKDIARKQKRRLNYISNIYMIDDIKHPENNGKVFLYRYGKKIHDKIKEAMVPAFADEVAINPFDLWKGANFKLKIRKYEGYQNYDKSEFESQSPLLDDESAMEKIYESEYSLLELVSDKEFKSYDEIKSRLDKVLGLGGTVRTTVEQAKVAPKTPTIDESQEDEDFDMTYFESLVDSE